MRPKKRVLCVSMDAVRLGVRTFLLETRGFSVVRASSVSAICELLHAAQIGAFDLLLVDMPLDGFDRSTLAQMRCLAPEMRVLVTTDDTGYDPNSGADAYLPSPANSPAELVERIKILTSRKRGPKPKRAAQGVPIKEAA